MTSFKRQDLHSILTELAVHTHPNTITTKPRLLALDANQRSTLAVTRSLGRMRAFTILTADETTQSLAGSSRYAASHHQHPSPAKNPTEFLTWLKEVIALENIDWVFPTTEITSQLILSEPEVLGRAKIPFAPLSKVMALADKWNLVQLARQTDIPCPDSKHYNNSAELLACVETITNYPVVLKPCQSRRWLGTGWLNTSVHIAESEPQLRQLLNDKVYFRDYPFMLQQYIAGHGAGLFALYDSGKPIAFFAHQRLREKPPQGGVSVLSESAYLTPDILRYAQVLLDAVQWHGVAMVEFRIAADGTPYLMEVNTRFWGSLQLAIDAGVDFPSLLYRVCNKETVTPVTTYRVGQRLRWLLGDIDSLYLTLRDPRFNRRQKLKSLLEFVIPHPFITRHEVNRWHDLRPAWHELKAYLRALRN